MLGERVTKEIYVKIASIILGGYFVSSLINFGFKTHMWVGTVADWCLFIHSVNLPSSAINSLWKSSISLM